MGALLRYVGFSIHEKHPSAEKTVIDYNLASIMMPAVMFGAFAGLYLSVMLPAAVTTILLTLILCYMTYGTYNKMRTLCHKEKRERENYQELQSNGSLHDARGENFGQLNIASQQQHSS